MYESFFQFKERPFTAAPRIERYYPAQTIEAARLAAARCIERAEGFAVVLGPSGTGKTLLCQVLAEQFRDTLTPVLLSGGRIASRKALLQAILFELGLPFRRREEGELRLTLMDRIAPTRDKGEGLLLLIDEAQTLSSKMFEELRLLSNVVRQGRSRVRLVFTGSGALEERLAHPKLTSFQQRIVVRTTISPFSAAETQEYVRAQTAVVGGDPDAIWTDEALATIHDLTDGVPRLINQVCDHALLLAAAGGVPQLDGRGIEEAWADLQQLPIASDPMQPGTQHRVDDASESEAVIEFGTLEDDMTTLRVAGTEPEPSTKRIPGSGSIAPITVQELSSTSSFTEDSDDYMPPLSGPTEGELLMDEPVFAEPLLTGDPASAAEDNSVYAHFPLVDRAPATSDLSVVGPDAAAADETADWVPVLVKQHAQRSDSGHDDPVLPDPTADAASTVYCEPRVVPLRSFSEGPFATSPIVDDRTAGRSAAATHDWDPDIVMQEVFAVPTSFSEASSGWGTRPAAKQPVAIQKPPRRNRPRVFAQLFTQLLQQQTDAK